MDLFADLPEPSSSSSSPSLTAEKKTVREPKSLLKSSTPDLFDSLPEVHKSSLENISKGEKRKSTNESTEDLSGKKMVKDILKLKAYCAERKGERERMQDRHVILDAFHSELSDLSSNISRVAYYAVFDGHCGTRASHFAATNLHKHLAARLPKDFNSIEKDIKKCFIETFKKTDEEFLKLAKKPKPSWKDGTTVTVILVINNTLYIANVGDTKAVICRKKDLTKSSTLTLTVDHSPTQFDERMRIQKSGGLVRDGRVMGVLEISRSIGDGQFKTCGITCMPDVKRYQLTENDRFIVLACDRLWKVFSPDGAFEFINSVHKETCLNATETKSLADVAFETSCNKITSEAVRRGCSDNVTIMLISVG